MSTNSTAATSSKTHDVSHSNINNRPQTPDPSVSASTRSSFLGAGAASRISQLLSPRKAAAAAAAAAASGGQPTGTTTPQQQQKRGGLSPSALPLNGNGGGGGISNAAEAKELIAALTNERRLRTAAEEKLTATNRELEDLSASLFEQANNMVATERRARAALEERVNLLGKRDEEKRVRMGLLENAVLRLERAREMLAHKVEEKGEKEQVEDAGRRKDEETNEEEEADAVGRVKQVDKDGGHVKEAG